MRLWEFDQYDIGVSATVYCCFQLSLCLAGPTIYESRHLSLSVRRKITVNVFYSTFTNVFFIFVTFFLTFLTFFILGGTFFGNVFFIYELNIDCSGTYNRAPPPREARQDMP